MLCRIVAWLLAFLPLATCQFTNPTSGTIFAVGEKVNITYETEWKNYTIALWQRNSNGSGSTLGPIVFETTNGPVSSFDWTVQTYDLNLNSSQTFFFWLFKGNASFQGNSLYQISSSYFNITDKTISVKPSVTATETESTSTSSLGPTATDSSSSSSSSSSDTGLSTGARAGIGAAVSIFCLLVMGLVFLFMRYRSRKGREIDALRNESGTMTDYTNSVAELQSECVSSPPLHKVPVYQPPPGEEYEHPPVAELEA